MNIIDGKQHFKLLKLLEQVISKIKNHDVYKNLCKEYNIDIDFIDNLPMCFADLQVSARTENGIIYFNKKLIKNPNDIEHYMIHEFSHVLQQCLGEKPTNSVDLSNYLDDENEIDAFQNQIEYIDNEYGSNKAQQYTDQVLNHHNIKGKERNKKEKELMNYD